MSNRHYRPVLLLVATAFGMAPALAQDDPAAELDPLVAATAEVGSGLALARQQGGAGDLAAALSTTERVLIGYPDAVDAVLFHASLLCRIDDAEGARADLRQIEGHAVPDAAWSEVTAACGAVRRPAAAGGAQ